MVDPQDWTKITLMEKCPYYRDFKRPVLFTTRYNLGLSKGARNRQLTVLVR